MLDYRILYLTMCDAMYDGEKINLYKYLKKCINQGTSKVLVLYAKLTTLERNRKSTSDHVIGAEATAAATIEKLR